MDIQDVLFDRDVPLSVKQAFLQLMNDADGYVGPYTKVLTPTDTNDDVNGSQHAADGGTDFSYRDATASEIVNASTLGYYEYFSETLSGYTGHYYNGDGNHFEAVVVDPPAYAASYWI